MSEDRGALSVLVLEGAGALEWHAATGYDGQYYTLACERRVDVERVTAADTRSLAALDEDALTCVTCRDTSQSVVELTADGGQYWPYEAVVHGNDIDPDCLALTGSGKPCSYTAYESNEPPVCNTHASVEDPDIVDDAHQWARISDPGNGPVTVCVNCETLWHGLEPETAVDCPECAAAAGDRCRDESSTYSAPIPPHPERRQRAYQDLDHLVPCPANPMQAPDDDLDSHDSQQRLETDGGRDREAAAYMSETVELRIRGKRVHVTGLLAVLSVAGRQLRQAGLEPAATLATSVAADARSLEDLQDDAVSLWASEGEGWMADDPTEALDVDLVSAITDGGRLPERFETFVEAKGPSRLRCRGCGDRVRRRYLVDRVCPGCRYRARPDGGRRVQKTAMGGGVSAPIVGEGASELSPRYGIRIVADSGPIVDNRAIIAGDGTRNMKFPWAGRQHPRPLTDGGQEVCGRCGRSIDPGEWRCECGRDLVDQSRQVGRDQPPNRARLFLRDLPGLLLFTLAMVLLLTGATLLIVGGVLP